MTAVQWWCSAIGVPWSWDWRPYPGVWLFVLALALAYWWPARDTAGGGAAGGGGRRPGRRLAGVAGVLLVWIALDWPVGALGGGYLASVHMVQYILLALVAPPLLVIGLPPATEARIGRSAVATRALVALTHPVGGTALFVGTFLATHAPPVTDTLMASQLGSFVLDVGWLGTGVLFWWPLVATPPGRRPRAPLARIGCLIAGAIPHTPVGMWLILTSHPVYATFELAPRVHLLDARLDQQLAGGIMLLGGGTFMVMMLSAIFLRWQGADGEGRRPVPDATA